VAQTGPGAAGAHPLKVGGGGRSDEAMDKPTVHKHEGTVALQNMAWPRVHVIRTTPPLERRGGRPPALNPPAVR